MNRMAYMLNGRVAAHDNSISMEELDKLAREPNTVMVSCEANLNLEHLKDRIWDALALIRVYTKKRGEYPDFADGIVMRRNSTIEHVCHAIHRTLPRVFKNALLWGVSAKHQPQKVGLHNPVSDEDVIQIVKKI